MKGNDDKRQHVIPFMKCFTGLVGAFTPEEVIFMLYMADRTRLREKGYDTLRSKRYYMENMEMGSRIFDKCVENCLNGCRSAGCTITCGTWIPTTGL